MQSICLQPQPQPSQQQPTSWACRQWAKEPHLSRLVARDGEIRDAGRADLISNDELNERDSFQLIGGGSLSLASCASGASPTTCAGGSSTRLQ